MQGPPPGGIGPNQQRRLEQNLQIPNFRQRQVDRPKE
jgi:hypothetical protein